MDTRFVWEEYRLGGCYNEYRRRLVIAKRPYQLGVYDPYGFDLCECQSPIVRVEGVERRVLKSFKNLNEARDYADTLTPWERVEDDQNAWVKGCVKVLCRTLADIPQRMLDDKGRLWSVYLHNDFVSSHNCGRVAQEMAEAIYDAELAARWA